MAQIYGRNYSKRELLEHVGDVSQIAGVRSVRLQDGAEDGVRALEFATGSGLEFTVLADRGFDISRAVYRGRSLAWRSATGDQHPSRYEPQGLGWLRTFYGGLVVTCGLAQAGAPNTDEGEDMPLHGRISHIPAHEVAVRQHWQGDDLILEARGKMRESVVFGENLTLERTVSTSLGSSSLRIQDSVTNEGFQRSPHMMLYHINIGFPVVDGGARLLAPSRQVEARDEDAEAGYDSLRQMEPPTSGFNEQVFFHQMQAARDGYVTVALVNENFPGGPFGVWLRYHQMNLPRFSEWKMNGQGVYVCGLEPGNCNTLGRAWERQQGTLVELDPWESVRYDLEIGVVDGEDEYGRIRELTVVEE